MGALGSATPHLDVAHKMLDFGSKMMNHVGNLAKQSQEATQNVVPESQAIAEKGQNINQYLDAVRAERQGTPSPAATPAQEPAPTDMVNPNPQMAAYGAQPGEERLNTEEMTKPLGQIKSFDNGGDVDKDQVAMVHAGEKVLNPQEAEQYRQQQAQSPDTSSQEGLGTIAAPTDERYSAEMHQPGEEGGGTTVEKDPVPPPQPSEQPSAAMKPLPGTPAPEPEAPKAPYAQNEAAGLPAVSKEHQEQVAGLGTVSPKSIEQSSHEAAAAKYSQQSQALRDAHEKAVLSGDPVAMGKTKLAMQEFSKMHPYGSFENHPGFMGKLGHVLGQIGQTALTIAAPEVAGFVPGNPIHEAAQSQGAQQMVQHGADVDLKEAQAKEAANKMQPVTDAQQRKAYADLLGVYNAETDPARKAAMKAQLENMAASFQLGKQDQKDPDMKQQYADAEKRKADAEAKGDTVGAQAAQAEMDRIEQAATLGQKDTVNSAKVKQDFSNVVAKMAKAGLSTDPSRLPTTLKAAAAKGIISADEAAAAHGYMAANPTPATNIQVSGAEAQQKQTIKEASQSYTWTDPNTGERKYGKGNTVPQGVEATHVEKPEQFANEFRTSNVVQDSLNTIAKSAYEHPEVWDNAAARSILATTLEQVDRSSAAMLVAGTGGHIPLPSGLGDMINTSLQNSSLDSKTARALKDYIADYKSMKDKVIIMQMEAQGGKIGRGSAQQFQAVADQIPNGKTPDSTEAKRQVLNMQNMQSALTEKFPESLDGTAKSKPYEHKEPTHAQKSAGRESQSSTTAPANASHEVTKDGRLIGHVVNNKFVPLGK